MYKQTGVSPHTHSAREQWRGNSIQCLFIVSIATSRNTPDKVFRAVSVKTEPSLVQGKIPLFNHKVALRISIGRNATGPCCAIKLALFGITESSCLYGLKYSFQCLRYVAMEKSTNIWRSFALQLTRMATWIGHGESELGGEPRSREKRHLYEWSSSAWLWRPLCRCWGRQS